MKAWFAACLIPRLSAKTEDSLNLLGADDTLTLLQASVVRNHVSVPTNLPDMDLVPGTDDFTVMLYPPPNPQLVQNDGGHCFKGWAKRFGFYTGSAEFCTTQERTANGTDCQQSSMGTTFIEACCPGTCSKAKEMNPVKWVMDNKREEEARCMMRYVHNAEKNRFTYHPRRRLFGNENALQTCDMIIQGVQGWLPDGSRRHQLQTTPTKPNLRKLDGTWVYEQCWSQPILQECCPKECANAQKTPEVSGPPAVDKSLYRDPPEWKAIEYDYVYPYPNLNFWWAFYPKTLKWKGDVCWFSSNVAYGVGQTGAVYGGLSQFKDGVSQKKLTNMPFEPQHFWAGGIRCEDIPLISEVGFRPLHHSVDPDLDAPERLYKQYAETWGLCQYTAVAQCCPAICGFTTCGLPDVGGEGNPAIECKTQKQYNTTSETYVDLPRTVWYGNPSGDETSLIEVGPGTPTPAPGLQPQPTTPTSATTTPVVVVCPGTDNPDEGTGPTDQDCFDAEKGFGADFSCTNTDMFCGQDSGDGITVGMCCPDKCRTEFEKKKKNEKEDSQKENRKERREKRRENDQKRKEAERERKKKRKDEEWNSKREQKEGENKVKEGERKDKRNFAEGKRKKERTWKQNRREKSQKANQRERGRKEKRNKDKPGLEGQECFATKANWGPLYYCRLAEDSCGGDDDAAIVDCCPNACQTTTTTTGPGQECFARDSSNWPGDWHCNQLPPVKNYCGCGDEVEAKVKECCPKMCIATDVCGGFTGTKPESPPNLEKERKKKRATAEQLRKKHRSERKSKRSKAEKKRKIGNQTPTKHDCAKQLKNWKRCANKKGCEKGQKKKGNSEPNCA